MSAKFDRKKVRVIVAPNGLVHTFVDINRREVGEVLDCASSGWNVRIDRGGKPYRYIAGVKTATPEAAYEYAQQFAYTVDETD